MMELVHCIYCNQDFDPEDYYDYEENTTIIIDCPSCNKRIRYKWHRLVDFETEEKVCDLNDHIYIKGQAGNEWCEICGEEKIYFCGGCGDSGPYGQHCPNCGTLFKWTNEQMDDPKCLELIQKEIKETKRPY